MSKAEEKRITIRNLGQGTHIFGAAHQHPIDEKTGKPDTSKPCVILCSLQELGPKGAPNDSIDLNVDQLKFYDDEALQQRIESREWALLVNGRDIRPELAKRDEAKAAALAARYQPTPATESVATQESSILADILSEGDAKIGE